jgi:hypothetical protein
MQAKSCNRLLLSLGLIVFFTMIYKNFNHSSPSLEKHSFSFLNDALVINRSGVFTTGKYTHNLIIDALNSKLGKIWFVKKLFDLIVPPEQKKCVWKVPFKGQKLALVLIEPRNHSNLKGVLYNAANGKL